MLLVQFIENAFKHGANQNIGKVRISIQIKIEDTFLHFRVSNTKPKNPALPIKKKTGGIGLSNVEKRLKLRYGDDEYQLGIHEELDEYIVNLKLKLR